MDAMCVAAWSDSLDEGSTGRFPVGGELVHLEMLINGAFGAEMS